MTDHPATPDAALRLKGVDKSFGTTRAVESLDLEVPRGRITALLGPSGCGKTTVLRLIAGLEQPDQGTIEIRGRVVAATRLFVPPERRRVGLVFQDYALFPHLNAGRNVAYGLRNVDRATRRDRVRDVMHLVGLRGYGYRMPSELSGGQQQRVAIARALAPEPDVILLDEPFSNLDASLRATVRADVRRILLDAGATALFVTHDQEEALALADLVAVMGEGRIHQVADPHTLYTRPATQFVAEFVGEADLLVGHRAGRFFVDTAIGRLETIEPVMSERVTAVVRPESLRLRPRPTGTARVEAVQYFGHDQLVEVILPDGTRLRSRQGPGLTLAAGDPVDIEVAERVLAFA